MPALSAAANGSALLPELPPSFLARRFSRWVQEDGGCCLLDNHLVVSIVSGCVLTVHLEGLQSQTPRIFEDDMNGVHVLRLCGWPDPHVPIKCGSVDLTRRCPLPEPDDQE